MKNSLLIMLATSSAALLMGVASPDAVALPGAVVGAVNQEDVVTIRINEETGVAEMEENGQWIQLKAVELPTDAKVEKTQYYGQGYGYGYGYANPCGTSIYANPCQQPCVNCVPPPVDPCASNCGVYAVPGYNYGYAAPYYQAPPVLPPVVYPRAYYRRGPSVYYNYPRPRYQRYPRRYY